VPAVSLKMSVLISAPNAVDKYPLRVEPRPAPHPVTVGPSGLEAYRREEKKGEPRGTDSVKCISETIHKFLRETDLHLEFIKRKESGEIVARVIHDPSGKVVREYAVIAMISFLSGTDRKI
jgi:hypothetical protein